jgi:branched-subunit amino acid ABC-type transport system permease component
MVDVASVLDGLLLGSLYAMMGLGLTMTYAITRVPNFAHAEYVTLGAYTTVLFANFLGTYIVEAAVASFIVGALVAVASDELVYKPLFRRKATSLHLLVASIGVGLFIRYVLAIFLERYSHDTGVDLLTIRPFISEDVIATVAGVTITNLYLWAIPTAIGVAVVLHVLLTRTRLGKGMRAMASNFDLARVAGIRTATVRRFTWILAGGLAGMSGAFWAVAVPVTLETGWGVLLWIFAASILGGFVSFYGTIAGGFIVGLAENVGIIEMHRAFGISLSYRPLIALVIIVIVFLVRPAGLARLTMADLRAFPERFRRLASRIRSALRPG